MSTLLQADIFFFITSIAVVVLLVIASAIGYFVFKLVRHAEYIARKIRKESDTISNDIAYLRENIKAKVSQSSFGALGLLSFITSIFKRSDSRRSKNNGSKSTKGRTTKAKPAEAEEVYEEEVE